MIIPYELQKYNPRNSIETTFHGFFIIPFKEKYFVGSFPEKELQNFTKILTNKGEVLKRVDYFSNQEFLW